MTMRVLVDNLTDVKMGNSKKNHPGGYDATRKLGTLTATATNITAHAAPNFRRSLHTCACTARIVSSSTIRSGPNTGGRRRRLREVVGRDFCVLFSVWEKYALLFAPPEGAARSFDIDVRGALMWLAELLG